jgi:hypothetical protein
MSNVAKIDIGLRVENLGDNVVTDHAWMTSGLRRITRNVIYLSKSSVPLRAFLSMGTAGLMRPKGMYIRLISVVSATTHPGLQIFQSKATRISKVCCMHLSVGQATFFKPYSTFGYKLRASTVAGDKGVGTYVEFVAFGV